MVSITQKGELEFSQVSKVLFRERRGFSFIWIISLPSGNWAQGVHLGTKVLGSHHRAVVWSQRALRSKREEQRRRLDYSPSLTIHPAASFIALPLSLPSYLLILLETLVKCCFFPPRTQENSSFLWYHCLSPINTLFKKKKKNMYPVADTWCISQNQYNIVKKKKNK